MINRSSWSAAIGRLLDQLDAAGQADDTIVVYLKWRVVDGDSSNVARIRQIEHADPGASTMLVDLARDAGETTNLADERPAEVARLTAAFERWRDSLSAGAGTPPSAP